MYFYCTSCPFSCSNKTSFDLHHEEKHNGHKFIIFTSDDVKCPFCSRNMKQTRVSNRVQHVRICTLNEFRSTHLPFICNYCNRVFTRNFNLVRHVERHHKQLAERRSVQLDENLITEYVTGDVPAEELYDTITINELSAIGTKTTSHKFKFTQKALNVAAGGLLLPVVTGIIRNKIMFFEQYKFIFICRRHQPYAPNV